MLFKARLRWREKLELLVLFSGGLFVMMAGILRCVLILTVSIDAPFNLISDLISDSSRLVQMVLNKLAAGHVARPSSLSSSEICR